MTSHYRRIIPSLLPFFPHKRRYKIIATKHIFAKLSRIDHFIVINAHKHHTIVTQ